MPSVDRAMVLKELASSVHAVVRNSQSYIMINDCRNWVFSKTKKCPIAEKTSQKVIVRKEVYKCGNVL